MVKAFIELHGANRCYAQVELTGPEFEGVTFEQDSVNDAFRSFVEGQAGNTERQTFVAEEFAKAAEDRQNPEDNRVADNDLSKSEYVVSASNRDAKEEIDRDEADDVRAETDENFRKTVADRDEEFARGEAKRADDANKAMVEANREAAKSDDAPAQATPEPKRDDEPKKSEAPKKSAARKSDKKS